VLKVQSPYIFVSYLRAAPPHLSVPRTSVESRETVLTSRPVPWNPSSSLKFVYSARPTPPQPSPANRHSVRETFLKCLLTSLRVPLTSSLCDPFSKTFRVVSLCEREMGQKLPVGVPIRTPGRCNAMRPCTLHRRRSSRCLRRTVKSALQLADGGARLCCPLTAVSAQAERRVPNGAHCASKCSHVASLTNYETQDGARPCVCSAVWRREARGGAAALVPMDVGQKVSPSPLRTPCRCGERAARAVAAWCSAALGCFRVSSFTAP